eukprot:COSAG01_NODE_4163_length_5278_cov_155.844951_3_plen_461_part_00
MQVRSSLGASGLVVPIVDSHDQLPSCEEGDSPSLIYQTDATLNIMQLLTCSSQDGAAAWRPVLVQGGLIYHGSDDTAWAAAISSGLPGIVELDMPPQSTTISGALRVVNGQKVRMVGSQRTTLTLSRDVVVTNGGTLTLDGGGSAAFSGGVTVASGGSLRLGSPLTLMDGVTLLFALVTSSAGQVSFGSGAVTLADAQGATLGTATGSIPGTSTVHLDLPTSKLTNISGAVHVVTDQHVRVTSHYSIVSHLLGGVASVSFHGGVTVASGGTLTLDSPLTLLDSVTVWWALVHSAGNVSFGTGGLTLADAQGTTLCTATGSFPGDVQLTQLTAAGKTAFRASTASATVSRDAHGAINASGLEGVFASVSGPCTLSSSNSCVERIPYGNDERCNIAVGVGGTLGACPSFSTEESYDILNIDGHKYSGTNCPQGVILASGSTIRWHSDGDTIPDSNPGWKICF